MLASLKAAPALALFFFWSAFALQAQDINGNYLFSDGQTHTINYGDLTVGKEYLEVKIPSSVSYSYLILGTKGGDGGSIDRSGSINWNETGSGALLQARFEIGTGDNQLRPGSTLRFFAGAKGGRSDYSGGGGGASGITYQAAGSSTWQTLMVAGGAGGNGHNTNTVLTVTNHPGGNASASITNSGSGSSPDNGGGSMLYSGSLSAVTGGSAFNASNMILGAAGGQDHSDGGSGFSGGGGGSNEIDRFNNAGGFGGSGGRGGGGGGYTGGQRGDIGRAGSSGTSYLKTSTSVVSLILKDGSNTSSAENGYLIYAFSNSTQTSTIKFAYNTGKCIDDYGSRISNGTNIQTYNCTGNSNQEWVFSPEDRMIRLALNAQKCLDLSGGNTSNGTNIQLWDCQSGNANQLWLYNGIHKTIHSGKNSDKCFDAANGSSNSNSNVNIQLWSCNYSNNNQKWTIDGATTVSDPATVKHIVPVLATSFAVHSHTGAESGSNIQLWTKDNTNYAEQWYFDGLAIKMRDHQNLCVDLSSSSTSNGNNIQLYNCNGTNAQKWIYDGMTQTIRSVVNPDKCMQIEKNTDGAYGKRSNVEIYDCNGSEEQLFLIQE